LGKQTGNPFSGALAVSPDGRLAAVIDREKTLFVWDLATGKQQRRFGGIGSNLSSVAFTPDSKRLAAASGGQNSRTWIWNIETGFMEWPKATGPVMGPVCILFPPDGKQLASVGWHGPVHLWDIAAAKEVLAFGGGRKQGGGFYHAAFSPDGRFLAGGGG